MTGRTAYAWHQDSLGHATPAYHPENPERARVLTPEVIFKDLPELQSVTIDQHLGSPWIRRVHQSSYLDTIEQKVRQGARAIDSGETLLLSDTIDVATRAVSSALSLVRLVLAGDAENGFAAIRPPGHHAGPGNGRGFCYFNNVGIAARFAQQLGAKRVLIVDWDVHPADGTSALFYDDPDVFVYSIHEHGIFTKTVGLPEHVGVGAGRGATLNVPVERGTNADAFLGHFKEGLEIAAGRCRPDLILVSCGFDAHAGDPLGHLQLEDSTYTTLTREIRRAANTFCEGRVVSLLEGGYSPKILARCVRKHMEALLE